MIIILINYSTADQQEQYINSFILNGAEIENYTRSNTYSDYSIRFNLVNYWYSGIVDWNISDPLTLNQSTVPGNKNILVENTYSQGTKKPLLLAYLLGYTSAVKDYFEVRPLKIESYSVLEESHESTVSELVILNNQDNNQTFTWKLDTGEKNITNTTIVTDDIFIFVESNYTNKGVHRTEARVNSTSYADTEDKGVVIS
jgi:hypothetical protein